MKERTFFAKISRFLLRIIFIPLEVIVFLFCCLLVYLIYASSIAQPEVPNISIAERQKIGKNHYKIGNNYLKKNDFGIWEMYIEGEPYERGLIYGELAEELIQEQEDIFVQQINQFVPSSIWQQFLKLFIGYFNRKIPANIPLENQQEIYGISQAFSEKHNGIAPKYTRILNYHAAHDIGHALNDYSMIGCTSFAVRNEKSEDGKLRIGRNFDFYVGKKFAQQKLLLFVHPENGYGFASYSWAGFTGVASGLNTEGISVTINAAKSDLPKSSKTPISILAREILQYAATTKEAVEIAKKRATFVSESILVGSAKENKAILIEKSPKKMGVFEMQGNRLVCANHYQSETFQKDSVNIQNIRESDSNYRFEKVQQLLQGKDSLKMTDVASILRNQKALHGDTLGMGNPRAINQLIAHHSVIFFPDKARMYVSTHDFQLGEYLGYDLQKTFSTKKAKIVDTIPADAFLYSENYARFKVFQQWKQKITAFLLLDKDFDFPEIEQLEFVQSNSESYMTFALLARYFHKKKECKKVRHFVELALSKKVASLEVEEELMSLPKSCENF